MRGASSRGPAGAQDSGASGASGARLTARRRAALAAPSPARPPLHSPNAALETRTARVHEQPGSSMIRPRERLLLLDPTADSFALHASMLKQPLQCTAKVNIMITLTQVPYDINSQNDIVRTTLQTKRLSQMNPGTGPHSCWAGVAYFFQNELKLQTGFSQMKMELEFSPYQNSWVKYHGELSCLANALQEIMDNGHSPGQFFPILGVYVEMSPCSKCGPALANLLPPFTSVFYSFNYETERAQWQTAATALCR